MSDRAELREEQVAFDTFWAAYPRHVAKIAASRAFTKAIRKTTLKVMLSALEAQRGTRQWREGFIPNASTWLHQERWTDEVAPAPLVQLAQSIMRNAPENADETAHLEKLRAGMADRARQNAEDNGEEYYRRHPEFRPRKSS